MKSKKQITLLSADTSRWDSCLKILSKLNLEVFLNLSLRRQKVLLGFLKHPTKFLRLKLGAATGTRIVATLEPSDRLTDLALAIRAIEVRKPLIIKQVAHKSKANPRWLRPGNSAKAVQYLIFAFIYLNAANLGKCDNIGDGRLYSCPFCAFQIAGNLVKSSLQSGGCCICEKINPKVRIVRDGNLGFYVGYHIKKIPFPLRGAGVLLAPDSEPVSEQKNHQAASDGGSKVRQNLQECFGHFVSGMVGAIIAIIAIRRRLPLSP